MLGVDELVVGAAAEVFDVFGEEDVGGWVLCEEDDLGAAGGQGRGYLRADAGCAALITSALV